MQRLNYNKQLLKCLFAIGRHEVRNYYYYLIVKRHFYLKSGIFSLDALMDMLYRYYDHKQLHHGQGNKRKRFRDRLHGELARSILFRKRPDGTFSLISEKHLAGNSLRFPVDDKDLLSQRAFMDAALAVIQAQNTFKSYERTSKQTGLTPRRIMAANRRLEASGRLQKWHNLILVAERRGILDIEALRQAYFIEFGINTPEPIKCRYRGKQTYWLAFYAANSYTLRDVRGDKGFGHFRDAKSGRRLKPIDEQNYFSTNDRLWEWTPQYSMQDYLDEHSQGAELTA